jgi:hypothetical protein
MGPRIAGLTYMDWMWPSKAQLGST